MTPKERMQKVWAFESADRVPFVPAVYEQKAFLVNDTPTNVSRNAELFYKAMMVEYETYQADALVIGLDVYNLEAEALGGKVTFYDDTSIPGISGGGHPLSFGEDLAGLRVPNPLKDGRMPVNLEVARLMSKWTDTVPVRGAMSGPFSLAISLLGPESLFIGTLDDPQYCEQVFSFCADVIVTFGKAYLDCGVGIILFDSQASPELLSPQMYEEMILPHTRRIITELFDYGEKYAPLIIGGNTTPMLDAYLQTGSKQILCDFSADFDEFRRSCTAARVSCRRNLNPILVQKGTPEDIARAAEGYLKEAEGMNGFILGTAVVPYGTPAENVRAVREQVMAVSSSAEPC